MLVLTGWPKLSLREASLLWAIGTYLWTPNRIWKQVFVYSLKRILLRRKVQNPMVAFQVRMDRKWKLEGMVCLNNESCWYYLRGGGNQDDNDDNDNGLESKHMELPCL